MRKNKPVFLLMGFLLVIFSKGSAQTGSFYSLNIPGSASITAMGGYNISSALVKNGAYLENPALFNDSLTYQTTAWFTPYFFNINHAGISTGLELPGIKNFFVDLSRTGYGTIDGYDASGHSTGAFSPADVKISIGKSFSEGSFSLGVKLSYLNTSFSTFRGNAIAFDIGGAFTHPEKQLTAALLIKNLGFSFGNPGGVNEKPPFDIRAGTTFKPEFMPFRFTFTAYNLLPYPSSWIDVNAEDRAPVNKVLRYFNAGTELLLSDNIHVLAGYNFKRAEELNPENTSAGAGFSFGFRIITRKFLFEYGRAKYHTAGSNNQISLSVNIKDILDNKK